MAVTGQQVYNISLSLIDEVTTTGTIDLSNLALKTKAVQFLTVLQAEMTPNATDSVIVTNLADPLLLSDRECLLILPYGLAAHLVIQDDAASASFFQQRYEELRKKKRATIGPIVEVNYVTSSPLVIDGGTVDEGPTTPAPDDEVWDGGTF